MQELVSRMEGQMSDPYAQWLAALGNLDPATTSDPSLGRADWWIKHCRQVARAAERTCYAVDQFSIGCDVTNCPHLECLCEGFAGDGTVPAAPGTDVVRVHALMTAFYKVYSTKQLVVEAMQAMSAIMEVRDIMVKLSSSNDNSTHVGEYNCILSGGGTCCNVI